MGMTTPLRRYEFGERLAAILGESRRDLRHRVTLLVAGGLIPPGPRGPGSPHATPDYAADLLIGVMAAPKQTYTAEAVRCYRDLRPTRRFGGGLASGVTLGARPRLPTLDVPPVTARGSTFGLALARLIARVHAYDGPAALAREVVGVWVGRGVPVAAIQTTSLTDDRSALVTQRYDLPEGAALPSWFGAGRDESVDPGLLHLVFLPVRKLLDIGALTAPPAERSPAMIELAPRLAELAALVRSKRNSGKWKVFLDRAAESLASVDAVDAQPSRLTEVTGFGANPGDLKMWTYVPADLPADSPLVVVLHGCTQTAHSYDEGTGWSTLADRHGFAVLLPEQKRTNNPLRCFNWFKPEDVARDGGEVQSIREMVSRMIADHKLDPKRAYVNGVSAGGAMTSAMLATCPDVFAGGAIIAGTPYGAATGLQEAFETIFQGRTLPADQWGARVRAASAHQGAWPAITIWHGEADRTVTPANAEEIAKQWADVHGLPQTPTHEDTLQGHRRRTWRDADERPLITSITVSDMSHGVPIDPTGENGCGAPAPFIIDAGISSTYRTAEAWGLTATRREVAPATRTAEDTTAPPRAAPDTAKEPPRAAPDMAKEPLRAAPDAAKEPDATPAAPPARVTAGERQKAHADDTGAPDLTSILSKSLGLAGLFGRSSGDGESNRTAPALGVDIPGILATSFEAAGLLKRSPDQRRPRRGATIAGVDIQNILETSFQAAGLLRPDAAGPVDAAPADGGFAGSGWQGDGWQLLPAAHPDEAPVLHGHAVSGGAGDAGSKIRSLSCRVTLGERPHLDYMRRLELRAATGALATAGFSVLVDGMPVDEATVTGMDYTEDMWTVRPDVDLSAFAGRTVTLTFDIAANSNIGTEVSAKAWVRDIVVGDAPAEAAADTAYGAPA